MRGKRWLDACGAVPDHQAGLKEDVGRGFAPPDALGAEHASLEPLIQAEHAQTQRQPLGRARGYAVWRVAEAVDEG